MVSFLQKKPDSKLFFSFRFTAIITLGMSLANIFFWLTDNLHNFFTGYLTNPNATMKIITSLSFILLACVYFTNNKVRIKFLISAGLIIQVLQVMALLFKLKLPELLATSSLLTICLFSLTYYSVYCIKIQRKKYQFLTSNSIVFILSSFIIYNYLLDIDQTKRIISSDLLNSESISWITAMLFFINAISLYEVKLTKRIGGLYKSQILPLKKCHPFNYFPYFFLIPIIIFWLACMLTFSNYMSHTSSVFIILLFLNISILISMFLYSYRFMDFYAEISSNTTKIHDNNIKLNILNDELKESNKYLADFASITSHNLREPIVALSELCSFYEESVKKRHLSQKEMRDMFKSNIQRLDVGLNALIQYHEFIQDVNQKLPQKISIAESLEQTFEKLDNQKPEGTVVQAEIKNNINLPKSHINNIFYNLLSNSFKYKKTFENLNIKILAYKTKDSYNLLYKDNGIGIDVENYKDELFKQGRRFHKESGPSNGYGLYYLKLYVTKLNGQIDLFSKVDKGTLFRIKLNYINGNG